MLSLLQVLRRLAEVLPTGVRVTAVADRGFGDQKLYCVLTEELRFRLRYLASWQPSGDRYRWGGAHDGGMGYTPAAGESSVGCATPKTGASAWGWDRCMSAPRNGATVFG
jgi:hypothetical protein